MKPSKQNNSEEKSKKKDVKGKGAVLGAVPKIQSYFKAAPKNFVVEDNNNNGCIDSQNIYVEALKKKLRDAHVVVRLESLAKEDHLSEHAGTGARKVADCEVNAKEDQSSKQIGVHDVDLPNPIESGGCVVEHSTECTRAECVQKAVECQEWERKYKELKKVYLNLTINYSEESMKYKNLLKVATRSAHSNGDEVALSDDGIFTSNEIKALQRIARDKPKDSTFILECLQYAYKSDLSVLCRKTLKGKSEWVEISDGGEEIHHAAKDAITPEKFERIKELFVDRISKCDIDSVAYGDRIKETNLNKLFASGIKNIAKKQP